jgi:uncharacterized protein (TIGR02147 family)
MQNPIVQELQSLFEQKQKQNARYSLRAFARDTGVDASSLSKMLNGKRALSEAMIRSIGENLSMPEREISQWLSKGLYYSAFLKKQQALLDSNFSPLQVEEFNLISSSEHFAFLECINLIDFDHSLDFFAKRLDISLERAQEIQERLIKFEFLKMDDRGQYLLLRGNTSLFSIPPANAAPLKTMQNEILLKAVDALHTVQLDSRIQNALIFSFTKNQISLIRDGFHRLLKEVNQESAKVGGNADEVYCMSLSLIPLTKNGDDS